MLTRLLDVLGSLVALLVLGPVVTLAALAIVVESRGGALFHARRMGRDGQTFSMLKLRTMRAAAGARITAADDARVTRVGRTLRRLHVDEIPQLWNVLRGEMSLVGPRPEDPALVDLSDPRWRQVLSVRPGITGPTQLAFARRESGALQLGLLGGAEIEEVYAREWLPAKLSSDVGYVETRSVAGDLRLLVRTLTLPFRNAA